MKKVRTAFFEKKAAKKLLISLGLCWRGRVSPSKQKFFAELFFKKATTCFALSALIFA